MTDLSSEQLLLRLAEGHSDAFAQLFERFRARLRAMIALRIDPRLVGRTDASDIIQETFLEAQRQLPEYLESQPLEVYVWLRQLAWQKLMQAHRRHLLAKRRSISREQDLQRTLGRQSSARLADMLACGQPSPSAIVDREERRHRVLNALDELSDQDREILLLRLVEQLSIRETAEVLAIAEGTVGSRQFRALERLRTALADLA